MDRYNFSWVVNEMNSTNLKSFKIFGLFNRYDIELPFDKQVNIFIGENGLGKTTILNCLYYVLEKKYTQLENIPFQKIEISFKNSYAPLTINKIDVIAYNQKRNGRRAFYDEDFFDFFLSELRITQDDLDVLSADEFNYLVHHYSNMQGIPPHVARKQLINMIETRNMSKHGRIKGDEKKIQTLNKAINENVTERIIYLPTYRRIENDFSTLNIRNEELNNSELLIRFGMSDVQKYIDTILDQIRNLAVEGFNKMTGLLLGQYTDGDNILSHGSNTINLEIVKIVLNRLGDKIDLETKHNIIKLIETEKIYGRNYLHLLNLLHKLIANYDQQKHYDDRINGFVDTCNKYLNDKQFRYNPSNLTLKIYMDDAHEDQEPVKLTQLSSGEKQIVSLFSKLYLESDEESIVIIDEPELSLSIKWQQMLLPDIMRSQNCKFLLTVTHSPFVFENEFDMDAREIRAYMSKGDGGF
ncbi:MAG: AAA family ATPase [Oscillospiraceae bacterium]|nr:AAA family ATPase [Oscillospiraceae bacterium]MBQ3501440.1 AAA family ATPase [Oscillospiraceae bacterium]MBQ6878242.1 AAA family ATPase [Oscillospiraceae bacterium]